MQKVLPSAAGVQELELLNLAGLCPKLCPVAPWRGLFPLERVRGDSAQTQANATPHKLS